MKLLDVLNVVCKEYSRIVRGAIPQRRRPDAGRKWDDGITTFGKPKLCACVFGGGKP